MDQKLRIKNLDKSVTSLNGINGGRGGRPNAVPFTCNIFFKETVANKLDSSFTVIGAHNAVDEIGLLNIQLPSDKNGDNRRINIGPLDGLPNDSGVLSYEKYCDDIPFTFG